MSTPAQVTEAQLELAKAVLFSRDSVGRLLTAPMAAQLIADSEARACDQLRAEVARLHDDKPWLKEAHATLAAFRAEVERLSAEVANQKVQNNHNWQFQEISEEALKRAERAEAALAIERSTLSGVIQIKMHFEVELAKERARNTVLTEGLETARSYLSACGVAEIVTDAFDKIAAMKEAAP